MRRYFKRLYRNHPRTEHVDHHPNDTVCLRVHIWLMVDDDVGFRLIPNRKVYAMQQLHVNERATLSIQAVDEFGNLVDATVSNPQWTNSNELAAVSSNPTPEQLLLDPVTNAVGQETTVDVTVQINGVNFSASDQFTIVAGPVAGINLVTNFNPKNPPPNP